MELLQDSSQTGFLPWDSSHTGFLPHGIPATQESSHVEFLPHRIPPAEDSSRRGFLPQLLTKDTPDKIPAFDYRLLISPHRIVDRLSRLIVVPSHKPIVGVKLKEK